MDYTYWKKQNSSEPLFPDIEWNKPEQRDRAGKLGIIGGNTLGFAGVAEAYTVANNAGIGYSRVLLPDALKKTLPPSMTDVVFAETNQSGSLTKNAVTEMRALGDWADGILLIGDAGRSSETAIAYETFLEHYGGPLTLTRDAIDLIKNSPHALVDRPNTLLVMSLAQLQKLFQSVYYPKVITFSMQLLQLIEALHKFTITYPVSIAVLHKDHLVIANAGDVVTTEWTNPMAIWRGTIATRMASYWLWSPEKPLEAAASAIVTR